MSGELFNRLAKLGVVVALIAGVFAAGLLNNHSRALAQDKMKGQTFMVMAGAYSAANAEVIAFAPSSLKVHKGDTVMWHFGGFHNVHFQEKPIDLVIVPMVDGKPLPQINPAAAFPTFNSGNAYKGGDANSGLPVGPDAASTFSVVIDLAPGKYAYYCDVHPGMVGALEVVADDVAIPSPIEAAAMGGQEIEKAVIAAGETAQKMMAGEKMMAENGKAEVTTSIGGTGRVSFQRFFSPVAVIKAGESVTWTNPQDSIDPHTVTSAAWKGGEDLVPMEQKQGPPILAVGPGLLGDTQSGATVGASDQWNSGLFNPGQSFSLTFKEAGVYRYVCHIHPGMEAVVIVQ